MSFVNQATSPIFIEWSDFYYAYCMLIYLFAVIWSLTPKTMIYGKYLKMIMMFNWDNNWAYLFQTWIHRRLLISWNLLLSDYKTWHHHKIGRLMWGKVNAMRFFWFVFDINGFLVAISLWDAFSLTIFSLIRLAVALLISVTINLICCSSISVMTCFNHF